MISGIVITKNEEEMIEDCLKSLSFCDEIIIVDSGSTDRTLKLCENFTDKIYKINTDDFSEMRNYGAKQANEKWLLYVDADERVDHKLKDDILKSILKTDFSGFEIKRNNNFLGRWMKSGGWENEYLLRLMKKDSLKKWFGSLHETAEVNGRIGKIDAPLLHFSHRNLSSMVAKTNEWSEFEANARFENKHPRMTTPRFIKLFFKELFIRVLLKKAWKDGVIGVTEAIYQSYSLLITYLKLWEKQQQ